MMGQELLKEVFGINLHYLVYFKSLSFLVLVLIKSSLIVDLFVLIDSISVP